MKKFLILLLLLPLTGCATWSHSSTATPQGAANEVFSKTNPSQVQLTESDITDRPYNVIKDITVTVNKTTVFNEDPTQEQVNQKLKSEAAELGADAVILVRYGKGGVSFMSWGALGGKGRAVKFK